MAEFSELRSAFGRRSLLGGLTVAALGLLGRSRSRSAEATERFAERAANEPLRPPRLKSGDGVGILCPAGATFLQRDVDIVVDAARALGLNPHLGPHLRDRYGYLAGKDRDRADDVNRFFADPAIALLLPIRGDWGSSRILPYLDYDLIRANPKILVGFSDITALLLGIFARTGLMTFHGPNGLTSWLPPQTESFRRVLFDGEAAMFRNPPHPWDAARLMATRNRVRTITPGKATGPLVGGNLSVLSAIVGTPYTPDWDGAILFIEDIGENIYRIDRMLTHLKLAGILQRLAGFIFGTCNNCTPAEGYGALTLEEVVQDAVGDLKIPAWMGATIGHVEDIVTLPIGGEVAIDAEAGTIQMLEAAVV